MDSQHGEYPCNILLSFPLLCKVKSRSRRRRGSRNKWRLIQWWGVCCWSSSSSPVTVGLRLDSPLLLAEWSHDRIGVSHASSVATPSLFYPSFPKTNSFPSVSCLISISDLLLQIIRSYFFLPVTPLLISLMHLHLVLSPLCLLGEEFRVRFIINKGWF